MASEKIVSLKKETVKEIVDKIKNSEAVILFSYQGLSVSDLGKLRRELREIDGEVKVYKNTLTKRALDELKVDLTNFMEGPNALLFGKSLLEPIKVIANFAKNHDKLQIKLGY
jgi:large subunit ribosomal protein L10